MSNHGTRTSYEWDLELFAVEDGEDGDVLDHHHTTSLADFSADQLRDAILSTPAGGRATRLVLVRDTGNEFEGLKTRQWAYVQERKLPDLFDDEAIVPARFRKELEGALARAGL